MKRLLLILFLLPLIADAQLISLVIRNDTLFGFNPSTGSYTQYNKLIPPQAGQAGKIVSTNGTNFEWIAQGGGSMIYPAAGIPLSTGSAWAASNVDNTSDVNKPVSTATQTALDLKQDILKTKNLSWSQSGGGTTLSAWGPAQTATGTATAVTQLTTNEYTYNPRLEYLVTVAATTAVAGWRSGSATFNMGTTSTNGGFSYLVRSCICS